MLTRGLTFLRLARSLPAFLRQPTNPAAARAALHSRVAEREASLLEVVRRVIYGNPRSPYHALLRHCGCELGDLTRSISAHGVEGTLTRLRDQGVYLSFAELRGETPVRRGSLEITFSAADLDNVHRGTAVSGTTGGTRARPMSVAYDWPFIAEEADNECLLAQQHGIADRPLAFWYPLRGGIAGVHNLLMSLKCGRAPARWFAHSGPGTLREHAAVRHLRWAARRQGLLVPEVEVVGLEAAEVVARWLAQTRAQGERPVLRTFVSSAVRVARAALDRGLDISGATLCVGGESLTEARFRSMTTTGVTVVPRYVATETGLIAAACGARHGDEMHIYLDRVSVIPFAGDEVSPLLYTTLRASAPKVLLNAELGDAGALREGSCSCVFGELGMNLHVRGVHSSYRCTVEGMAVPLAAIDRIVGEIVTAAGGEAEHYQVQELVGEDGLRRLGVIIDPTVPVSTDPFLDLFYRRLGADVTRRAAADLWRQSRAVAVIREKPLVTQASKTPRFVGNASR